MSLCNLKSNWQSVYENSILKFSLSPWVHSNYNDSFLYISLVVCYLMVSNLCSALSVQWTNPPHCDLDLSTDCGLLKSAILIWVSVRASLKSWEVSDWLQELQGMPHIFKSYFLWHFFPPPWMLWGRPGPLLLLINVLNFIHLQSSMLECFAFIFGWGFFFSFLIFKVSFCICGWGK